jgi:acetolactate synthase-1/2/3 large subunit
MSGAEMLVQVLADEGVDTIFGYSGGAILPTFDAVFRFNADNARDGKEPMPLIVPANEQGAGFMAAGYARASGRPGVVLVTSGPGATNCVTPVRDCMADSIPIVVICGQVATGAIGTDAFQEAPVSAVMGAVAKHTFLVTDPTRLEATIRSAFEIARTGRPGPVVIDVPKDIQNWEGEFQGEGLLSLPGYHARLREIESSEFGDSSCAEFFELLAGSERPLIYAGGGVINGEASASLGEFARTFGIPVTTTLMGLGSFDTTDPLALHMLGMHGLASANYAVDDCDLLISMGARFDDRVAAVPDKFAAKARRILHFDIDPSEIHKVKAADWYHIGILRKALDNLTAYGRQHRIAPDFSRWHEEIAELKSTYGLNYDHDRLPAAIGAQFARPDKLVIDVDGDASIRMNLGELETATSYDLPVKIIVLNNFGDGMVMQWQRLFFKGRLSASDKSLRKKDFVKAAEADGFGYARRLDKKADVPAVLEEFLSYDGPAFLEVIIDPEANVYPMVGPGLSYRDIVTGPHIPNRYGEKDSEGTEPDASEMF